MRITVALSLIACALALGACGNKSDDAANASSSSDRDAARLRLQDCLRKQGIDIPTNPGQGGGPRSFDRSKLQKAMQGPCKKYQQAAFGNISAKDRQAMRDRMVKFASCMRQHGVDLPDPGQGGGRPQRFNLNSPGSKKAAEACQKLLPRPPGGGRGPGGPGGGGFFIGPPPGGSQ